MIRIAHPRGYASERHYAAQVVLGELLGLEHSLVEEERADVELTLVGEEGRVVLADVLFATPGDRWLAPDSLPRTPLARWRDAPGADRDLPVLYGEGRLEAADRTTRSALDVFGSAFFMLTRYEEAALTERDARDRFPAAASLAAREGFLGRPLVDEYVELLWAALLRVWPRLDPPARTLRVLPSHDVDVPFASRRVLRRLARAAAAGLVRRRDPRPALTWLRARTGRDPFDTFDFLLDESERRGLKSTFFVMTGPAGPGDEGDYSIDDPRIRRLLRTAHARGHEIGLHPSYDTFRDGDQMRFERDELARACAEEGIEPAPLGVRQHFLRWENPTTWQVADEAGFAYDSTLTFPEQPGFRCGTCREYPAFDLRSRRQLRLRERPLIVMDATLVEPQYLALSHERALETIRDLKRACRRFGGVFTILWHNDRLTSKRDRRLYLDALDA